ncbi:unnamed protein product [Litomosoides sigmodontis]|uniref:Uncharacterized protein n=1 Tax=Litomosoides sigmodontis TaxID=42156 RepID=A0A3P7KGE5_LITSI|nr:unnamed protein product [Litomosoides sigmodontis]
MSSAPNLHIQPDNGADAPQQLRPQAQGQIAAKKRRKLRKKHLKNAGIPPGIKINEIPVGAAASSAATQMNRPRMQQLPHITIDQARRPNLMRHPLAVGYTPPPINMAAIYQGLPSCWCTQVAGEMRAIREHMGAISNGIHCVIQKLHTDQLENEKMMSKMSNTIEMIAETLNHTPITQWQECDGYLIEDGTVGAFTNATINDPVEPFYVQHSEQVPPEQPPTNSNF